MQFSTKKIRVNFLFVKNTKPGGGVRGGFSRSLNFLRISFCATVPKCLTLYSSLSYICLTSVVTTQIAITHFHTFPHNCKSMFYLIAMVLSDDIQLRALSNKAVCALWCFYMVTTPSITILTTPSITGHIAALWKRLLPTAKMYNNVTSCCPKRFTWYCAGRIGFTCTNYYSTNKIWGHLPPGQ